jgi:uncharacterized protein (DUF4415 family)
MTLKIKISQYLPEQFSLDDALVKEIEKEKVRAYNTGLDDALMAAKQCRGKDFQTRINTPLKRFRGAIEKLKISNQVSN